MSQEIKQQNTGSELESAPQITAPEYHPNQKIAFLGLLGVVLSSGAMIYGVSSGSNEVAVVGGGLFVGTCLSAQVAELIAKHHHPK